MITLSKLSPEQREKLCAYRYDWFVEKHEGPWDWEGMLRFQHPEFLSVEGYDVLLPLDITHHPNITILRCFPSRDEDVLTVFLKDTTHYSGVDAGFLAICERVRDEHWYVTIVYHEWYLLEAPL